MPSSPIADRLLEWAARSGRHDLPWQLERTPYRVWVSEIMLQQTQVATVIPYFERFMARFPESARWPRRRSMRCCTCGRDWATTPARATCTAPHGRSATQHGGRFPRGVHRGRRRCPASAAPPPGAILALACGERFAILDGNVRRVLARYFAVAGRGE